MPVMRNPMAVIIGRVRAPRAVIGWITSIGIRRTPCPVSGTPEPGCNQRGTNIDRPNNIIRAVDIRITHGLYLSLPPLVLFNIERGHVLILVFTKHRLDAHQIRFILGALDDSQVIHFAVLIEIQIGDLPFRLVQFLFKVFDVFGLSKESHNDF
jgi:hypothetical protein